MTAKAMDRDLIAEIAGEDLLLKGFGKFRDGVLRFAEQNGASKKKLREIAETTDFDAIVDTIYGLQKVKPGGKGLLPYNPKNVGTRIVWDLDAKKFKSVSLDKIFRLRTVDPATGKIGQDINFLRQSAQEMLKEKGWASALGRGIARVGAVGQVPGDIVAKVGEKIGIPPELHGLAKRAWPVIGAGFNVPGGKALLGVQLTADALQGIGRRLMRDDGTILSKLLRSPVNQVQRTAEQLQKILNKDGLAAYRAAAYVAVRKVPGFAQAIQEDERKIHAVQVRGPAQTLPGEGSKRGTPQGNIRSLGK